MYGATTIKAIQCDTLKNTTDKSNWNSKKCSNNPQEGRKKKTEKQKNPPGNK